MQTGKKQSTHTPGPWNVDGGFIISQSETKSNGAPIAVADPYVDEAFISDNEVDANARLIAAAPELLEALGIMTALCKIKYGNLDKDVYAEILKAEAAIAKATGGAR